MAVSIEFVFDFVSPNVYFVHKAMPALLERTGVQVDIQPVLLGGLFKLTNNTPPMQAFGGVKGKLAYEMLEIKRFCKKHGIQNFKFNSAFPVNSVTMMRALLTVTEPEDRARYIDTCFQAVWEDDHNMGDTDVFQKVMNENGFDGAALVEASKDPAVKKKLLENTQAVADRGVFGAPTFFVGDEMFFGKERLGQVEEAVQAQLAHQG